MDDKDWIMLKTLYEENNVTKASERLFLSQPTLTHRIQQIEDELGVKIISRWKRGIKFTSEGEYLIQYCDEMLVRFRQMKDDLLNLKGDNVRGILRLGAVTFFAYNDLPDLLERFVGLFPHIKCDVVTGHSTALIKLIQNEELHVAIVRGDMTWWSGPKQPINVEDNICLISKHKIDIDSLPNRLRVNYKTVPELTKLTNDWWQDMFHEAPTTNIEVSDSQTCIEIVSKGSSYAIVPQYCLKNHNDLYTEDLRWKDGRLLKRKTWMVYHEKYLELAAVREFVSFIEKTRL
ncbi:MAG: LysR family transcriptional regulator [Negativicutes bacterium]